MSPGPEPAFTAALLAWSVMAFVMMAPVALPWLRAYGRMSLERGGGVRSVYLFGAGYSAAWGAFSATAAALQVALGSVDANIPLIGNAPTAAGGALLLAGTFQFTGLKGACLSHCRSPAGFFLNRWRPGPWGALAMGLQHGIHCLGCCWATMGLALVVGMADLRWMALLMTIMVLETAAPGGDRLVRPVGLALVLAGTGLLLGWVGP